MNLDPEPDPDDGADDDSDVRNFDSSDSDLAGEQCDSIVNEEADQDAGEFIEDSPEDEEEEFSLNQLSQAYAKVLRTTSGGATDRSSEMAGERNSEDAKARDNSRSDSKVSDSFRSQQDLPGGTTLEAIDNAGCPITPESIVEAILFVGVPADAKLTPKKVCSVLRDVSPKEIKGIIKKLNDRYAREQAVYRVKLQDGALSLELEESMFPFQQAYLRKNKGVKLNAATIEVLAVIAYNQPVSREQIDRARKKSSAAIVAQLARRGLVAEVTPAQKSEPQRFVTTDKFLDFFHLSELRDLPQSHEVSDLDELI